MDEIIKILNKIYHNFSLFNYLLPFNSLENAKIISLQDLPFETHSTKSRASLGRRTITDVRDNKFITLETGYKPYTLDNILQGRISRVRYLESSVESTQ